MVRKKKQHVFAVIRVDHGINDDVDLQSYITVKEIALTAEEAEREVSRLNVLNLSKGQRYFAQVTRLMDAKAIPAE